MPPHSSGATSRQRAAGAGHGAALARPPAPLPQSRARARVSHTCSGERSLERAGQRGRRERRQHQGAQSQPRPPHARPPPGPCHGPNSCDSVPAVPARGRAQVVAGNLRDVLEARYTLLTEASPRDR